MIFGSPVKVMANEEFGYARLTVERPLRRVWRFDPDTLATAPTVVSDAMAALSSAQLEALASGPLGSEKAVKAALGLATPDLDTKTVNAILKATATTDPDAEPVKAKKGGRYEPDPDLRDQENIPLPAGYIEMDDEQRAKAVREAAEAHLIAEIHPYVPDAWIDHDKTKIGYEIPFTRQFYVYSPPRPVAEIRADITPSPACHTPTRPRSRLCRNVCHE